ncbi:MAG: hypothetical protein IJ747_06245 [Lachnospiraceae bacterium]|nr:hypothetical protein [Lachnospiraceae bacterium]
MARGQRKTLDEKIEAKQEIIDALLTRIDSERAELAELMEAKRLQELEKVSEMMEEYGLDPEEVVQALQQFMDQKQEEAS